MGKIKWKKFAKNSLGDYSVVAEYAMTNYNASNFQAFVNALEDIPGSGDIRMSAWGQGRQFVWD